MREPDGFREFVAARSPALVRHAWLLTGDQGAAEDLVQTALVKTWSRWDRVVRQDAPEAYVRRVILSSFLSGRRRRWRGEVPTGELPERPSPYDAFGEADLRRAVHQALGLLPARQRAVVVLRYVEDLSEAQTAQLLGCAVGTVKSQAAKALAALRRSPELRGTWDEEADRDTR